MRFWDSTAVIPLVVSEPESSTMKKLQGDGNGIVTWWTTPLECLAALERVRRQRGLGPELVHAVRSRLRELGSEWHQVLPSEAIIEHAERLLRTYPLRSTDAVQLAAAIVLSDGRPATLEFVSLDARLGDAVRQEGFRLLP